MPVPTFRTLTTTKDFREPSKNGATTPILASLAAPHIESFNALFPDSGLPIPEDHEERGKGLLGLGIKEIGEKVVFDGVGADGHSSWGNKLASKPHTHAVFLSLLDGYVSSRGERRAWSTTCIRESQAGKTKTNIPI